jgi:SAM-dependent methyltransferase
MTATGEQPGAATTRAPEQWEELAGRWGALHPQTLWRTYCDELHTALIERWLPAERLERVLKTDLFDEIVTEGLYPVLARHACEVVGMDIAARAAAQAATRHRGLATLATDARALPFGDATFDAIISNSTLDHFPSLDDLGVALRELARITRPGGVLLLTLDNLANPVVALRSVLPRVPLKRLGLVPYYCGATCGPARLREIVEGSGFAVDRVEALLHCPRVLAVATARLVERYGSPATQRRYLRHLARYERLASWPTRERTSYFTAVRGVRVT